MMNCGIPWSPSNPTQGQVMMAHGGGGRLMQQLIHGVIRKNFNSTYLSNEHDAAILPVGSEKIAFTTDSFVVSPIFFPGGDLGKLAVYGTVNDLAMVGARPLYLSAGLILEEGFSLEKVDQILFSMKKAADECGVEIVTGDTSGIL